ncbi:ribonuclease D [Pedomonas mirosovicensis]|uniref:ribonuclease D n=1 Tax=Pedomonas mirosovicensis TaxID=2908641 RepID=UPI00216728B6|nr:ribonuclease D [Pedomonas mirosovicensis]MCH8685294.1 ribonuclease D [Pedomonas mirosovicensis]
MSEYVLITTTEDLSALCARLARQPFVALDTEFMRENSYYPDLCLIQVASTEEAAIIDPKAPRLSLEPLFTLLHNEEVLKVVHAGGQDLEIFHGLTGRVPAPLFDTQIAGMALGYGEQVGYQQLIEQTLGVHLNKGARFTDWSRRPLEQRQLDYAIGDVTYLAQAFPKLLDRLKATGRGEWLDEEMARLLDPSSYTIDPEQVWRRMKLPNRNAEVLGRLKALAAWREREAQTKNLPRNRLVKDETLTDLALHPPRDQGALARVRGLPSSWGGNEIGARLLAVLANAEPMPKDEIPTRERMTALGRQASLIADLLKLLLKIRCEESGIAPKLVCRADELEALAGGQREGLAILSGWRFEHFGKDALAMVEGRLAFSVRDGRLDLREIGPA